MATYAIIDSSQRVGFHRRLDDRGIAYHSLFEGHAEERHPEIAPLLFEWTSLPDQVNVKRVQSDVIHLAKERPAVSFVESDLNLKGVAEHFRRFHLTKLPNRRELLLRWYDTRILPIWMEVMTPTQCAGFVQGIRRWRMFDRLGEEVALVLPPEDRSELPALPPYSIDEAQYSRLIDACGTDLLIAHLREVAPDQMRILPLLVLYPFTQEHLAQARRHGLDTLNDQGHYLILALSTSGGFLQHPHVRERLALTANEHGQPFADWAMNVPDTVFDTGKPLWEYGFRDGETTRPGRWKE